MREIKFLGKMKKGNDNRNYPYSIFKCPICSSEVTRKTRDGKNQKFCSHECYAKNRPPRGAYVEKVEISGYLYIYQPDHPNAMKRGYIAEHRLALEKKLGRLLRSDEAMHLIYADEIEIIGSIYEHKHLLE